MGIMSAFNASVDGFRTILSANAASRKLREARSASRTASASKKKASAASTYTSSYYRPPPVPEVPQHDGSDTLPKLGQEMQDGSIYAGRVMRDDKSYAIYAMPHDMQEERGRKKKKQHLTYDEAEAAIDKLNDKNELGHNDWQLPEADMLDELRCSQLDGNLRGTFNGAANFLTGGRAPHDDLYLTVEREVRPGDSPPGYISFEYDDRRSPSHLRISTKAEKDERFLVRAVRVEPFKR